MISFKMFIHNNILVRLQVKTTLFCIIRVLSVFYSLVSNGADSVSLQNHLPEQT